MKENDSSDLHGRVEAKEVLSVFCAEQDGRRRSVAAAGKQCSFDDDVSAYDRIYCELVCLK